LAACNWYSGELLSLAIPYENADEFHAAGYAPVVTNSSYIGGQVRQYGNLSFTRVYEAGHEVPAYQPETAYRIFQRTIFNFDIATGNISTIDNATFSTAGPEKVDDIKNEVVTLPGSQCYVLDRDQCTAEQWETVENGTALVKNWIVVDANTTFLFPELTGNSTNGTLSTPSPTSSAPPDSTGAAARSFSVGSWMVGGLEVGICGNAVLVGVLGTFVVML
jgi:hypothetical protein